MFKGGVRGSYTIGLVVDRFSTDTVATGRPDRRAERG
jgi:hypothetical protein